MHVKQREIRRYLGYKNGVGKALEEEVLSKLIEQCIQELEEAITPRFVYEIFPLKLENNWVDMGFLQVESKNLAKNLRDCDMAAVMATTLGVEADRLINRYSRFHILKGVVMQATATAMIEAWCDECQQQVQKAAKEKGRYLRPRFSPGYGDFPLEAQKPMIEVLQAPKRIGLTVTDSFMMAPVKSVTAIIGFAKNDSGCLMDGCEACEKKECNFRRS